MARCVHLAAFVPHQDYVRIACDRCVAGVGGRHRAGVETRVEEGRIDASVFWGRADQLDVRSSREFNTRRALEWSTIRSSQDVAGPRGHGFGDFGGDFGLEALVHRELEMRLRM